MKKDLQHEAAVAMTSGARDARIGRHKSASGRTGPCTSRPKASWRLVQGALLLLSSAALLPAAHAQSAVLDTLAQQSLLVKEPIVVEPNLMFTLDDSGSMARNFLPETDTDQRVYAIHPDEPERYYFTVDGVLPTTDNHLLSAKRRSAAVNKLYYNPEVRYLPWRNENGDPMGNADPAAAWYHQGYRGAEHEHKSRAELVTQIANLRVNLVGARPVGNLQVCADEKPDPKQKCSPMSGVSEIYPATYYDFTGPANPTQADLDNIRNYKRVSIALHNDFKRGAGRTDCRADNAEATSHTCSQAQEYQNFANWFQYHRTRMHVAIAGIGTAFAALKPDVRVGYGRINKVTASPVDKVSTKVVERGVRRFEGADRKAFFTWLKNQISDGATPLVQATEVVGEYFERKDNDGPWSSEPGKSSQKKHLSCRRSFHLLMTDGLYNFSDAYSKPQSEFRLESDNVAGDEITGVKGKDGSTPRYRYQPENPYRSATSGTLADYAMHFWKRDLRTDLVNDVPTSSTNEAFWQHLSMFTLSFGVGGTLDPSPAGDYDALKAGTKQWPSKIEAEQPETIDDLWHAAINARGRYLNVQQGEDFVKGVGEILKEIEGRVGTIGGVSVNTQALQANNQKFVPSFNTRGWVGDVTAYRLDQNGQEQGIQWTAQEQLPAPANRNIFVGNGANSGVRSNELVWNTALPQGMRTMLITAAGKNEARDGASLVAWLRGDRKDEKESASAGGYRKRDGLATTVPLGHIVHSSPLYIGAAIDRGYALLPATLGGNDTGAAKYKAFVKAKRPQKADGTRDHAARPAQVFIGSNDGYLHAFDAETGRESYALVPHAVLSEFGRSSRHDYQPRFLMDGPLVEADAYWGNAWRNLVVGTTGAGPKAVFALDVSDTRTNTRTGLGASSLQWELNEQDEPELGHVLHAPEIGVTRSGRWVAVFGNGYQSRSRKAQLLVVDLQTGRVVRRIDTNAGNTSDPNGLGGVKLVRDGNQVITGAYAGDLLGNLWKFDLSDERDTEWKVAFGGSPLFTTQGRRPITAAPNFITHPNGGHMLLFGTGKLFHEGDDKTKNRESVYGIWDDARMVMQNGKLVWNGGSAITDDRKIKRLGWATSWRDGWRGHVIVTPTAINWQNDRGWAMTLNMTRLAGQRNIVQPQLVAGMVLFETLTPVLSEEEADNACRARINTPAFNLLLDPLSGAMAEKAVIDINLDGKIDRNDPVVGGWAVEDWSGRSVVLTEPPPAPCTTAPCQAAANVVRICADGSLRSNVQNANENSNLCFGIPAPGRWWWRELSVPDNPVAPGAVVPVEADQASGG